MNDIAPTPLNKTAQSTPAAPRTSTETRVSPEQAAPAAGRAADQVELSTQAQLLSRLRAGDVSRAQLVADVRREIEEGVYLTPDKLNQAADNLISDFEAYG